MIKINICFTHIYTNLNESCTKSLWVTKGINIPYYYTELSNDCGFDKDIISGARVILEKDGHVYSTFQEMSLSQTGYFFIKHGGYGNDDLQFNQEVHLVNNIDKSINLGEVIMVMLIQEMDLLIKKLK